MSATPPVAAAGTSCCAASTRCSAARGVPAEIGHGADRSLVHNISGNGATIGTDTPVFRADGEGPARRVTLRPFRMDAHAVTNPRFAASVAAAGQRTEDGRDRWPDAVRAVLPACLEALSAAGTPWWGQVYAAEGGSDLCHRSDCWRCRTAVVSGRSPDTTAGHVGFRRADDA